MLKRRTLIASSGLALLGTASAQSFDATYANWDALLKKHVRWLPDNKQSRVDYRGFAADRAQLQIVLDALSALSQTQFSAMQKPEQIAFLINAYNAFTVELILSKYPDLKSIKDLGSLVQSAWKKRFFKLLGREQHLDWIEHEQLRANYADPRVHSAMVCASIGCPALRPEAYTAAKLEVQLEDGMQRFLGDKTRNRFAGGKLEVSSIFKWFKEDFDKGHKGFASLADVWAKYAAQLADNPADVAALRSKQAVPVSYLAYDWLLNDVVR